MAVSAGGGGYVGLVPEGVVALAVAMRQAAGELADSAAQVRSALALAQLDSPVHRELDVTAEQLTALAGQLEARVAMASGFSIGGFGGPGLPGFAAALAGGMTGGVLSGGGPGRSPVGAAVAQLGALVADLEDRADVEGLPSWLAATLDDATAAAVGSVLAGLSVEQQRQALGAMTDGDLTVLAGGLVAAGATGTLDAMAAVDDRVEQAVFTARTAAAIDATRTRAGVTDQPVDGEGGVYGSAVTTPDVAERLTDIDTPELDAVLDQVTGDVSGDKRALLEGLADEQQKWLAVLAADRVGHLPSAPFAMRSNANNVRMSAGLNELDAEIASKRELIAAAEQAVERVGGRGGAHVPGSLYERLGELTVMKDEVAKRVGSETSVTSTVLWFDAIGPGGEGEIVELHGSLDSATNVGVIVPGTTHGMHRLADNTKRTLSFQNGSTPMITWMGADLPDGVFADAPFNDYATDAAPRLVGFSEQLDAELAARGLEADVGVAGHSYGGSVVGTAARNGLVADRIFHISSAGGGVGVEKVADYSDPDLEVYVMTDDDDFINYTQGEVISDDVGHGADPDTFDDATHVYTGSYLDGEGNPSREIEGPGHSHSAVFEPRTDAHRSITGFFQGTQVTTRPLVTRRWDVFSEQRFWREAGPGPKVDVP